MIIELKIHRTWLERTQHNLSKIEAPRGIELFDADEIHDLLHDALAAHKLHELVNNPHTHSFLEAVKFEAAHQRDRFGDAHARGKSAENWFWLVGYLAGKCLRAAITGDKEKAKHHTISSAAALANWFEAIDRDETGCAIGHDADIKPVELARFEGSDSLDKLQPYHSDY